MADLAFESGVSRGMIAALEAGRCQPSLGTLLALQSAFRVDSLEELLGLMPAYPSSVLIGMAMTDPAS